MKFCFQCLLLLLYLQKKVSREKRIPFDLRIDPFYSEENFKRLYMAIDDVNACKNVTEHDLIEID